MRYYYIIGKVRRAYMACLLAMVTLSLTSCVSDNNGSSDSIFDYTNNDVKSYGDLFDIFWKVMNQRYNYLNEQQGTFALNWDQVYSDYKPKFEALLTFDRSSKWTVSQIQADHDKAQEYFKEIVNHILDQHFRLTVKLPISHTSFDKVTFSSQGIQREGCTMPLWMHFDYTLQELCNDDNLIDYNTQNFSMLGGFVKGKPNTYYLAFSKFALGDNCTYSYKSQYLPQDKKSSYWLSKETIDQQISTLVDATGQRETIRQAAYKLYDSFENYMNSEDVKAAISKMVAYAQEGKYEGLLADVKKAHSEMPLPLQTFTNVDAVKQMQEQLEDGLQNHPEYDALNENLSFRTWLLKALAAYLCNVRELDSFCNDASFTLQHPLVELYPKCFIENLKSGKIQKLILDFRGNGGGAVSDTRLLTDFLITHSKAYCYIRLKEDNNPYSYTPWIPQYIEQTSNSIGRDIPIVCIIDQGSGSMSETTTLLLRGQGDHVRIVGRNSAGAFSMLSQSGAANGGWNGNVTDYLSFYMPFMAVKDLNGNILEGYGLTPDYTIDPISSDEATAINLQLPTAKDKFFDKAVETLK